MTNNCSCKSQIVNSASILHLKYEKEEEEPNWDFITGAITAEIDRTYADQKYVFVRPVGDCPSLKTLPFVAIKRIDQSNRNLIIKAQKRCILKELKSLGALDDIIDHVNQYPNHSLELTSLSQSLFYGARFEAGRHVVMQLVNYIDLRHGANQLINSVHDPEFHESNTPFLLPWAKVLRTHADLAIDAESRAKLIADYLRKGSREIVDKNCWNLFKKD